MAPLFVIEFLHRVVDTIIDYFSACSESVIKDQIVVVYEVRIVISLLTHCLLMPFETHRQITVEANVAGGYIDTGNINVSMNLPWMLSDQLCKS